MASRTDEAVVAALREQAEQKMSQSALATGERRPSKSAKESQPTFRLKVYSPYRIYYEEDTFSITASNETGPFDILPGHKNFLTLLGQGTLTIRNYRGEERLEVMRGVVHVQADSVTIFLDV